MSEAGGRAAPTAACVVIGDEILTGKIQDRNSHVLARVLFERGVRLIRVETIPDVLTDIAETVRRLSSSVDCVFTSGGIGPTHDDKTYEGVARAFGRTLACHEPTLERFEAYHRSKGRGPLNEARRRMALFPEGCEAWTTGELWVPLVVVENVHILPGVPELFEQMLHAHAHRFSGLPLWRVELFTDQFEGDIADTLDRAQAAHPEIAIGSYPQYGEDVAFKVKVTLEGLVQERVESLATELEASLPARRTPHEVAEP